jgi:hypothetical protein
MGVYSADTIFVQCNSLYSAAKNGVNSSFLLLNWYNASNKVV